jgi:hypothetical protein
MDITESISLLAVIFGGTFFGSFLGSLLLDEWKRYRERTEWLRPRQVIAKDLFSKSGMTTISLSDLARAFGCEPHEARRVMIFLGGIGTVMADGNEGWLIDRTKAVVVPRILD